MSGRGIRFERMMAEQDGVGRLQHRVAVLQLAHRRLWQGPEHVGDRADRAFVEQAARQIDRVQVLEPHVAVEPGDLAFREDAAHAVIVDAEDLRQAEEHSADVGIGRSRSR